MKIVSVAPNITEILLDMGITPDATTVHTSVGDEIVGKWLSPDLEAINDINPDIVFTSDSLQDKINKDLEDMGHNVKHYNPRRFDNLFDIIQDLGIKLESKEKSSRLEKSLRQRVDNVKEFVEEKERPTIYSEEWDKPPMAAGNWVPDMIEIAGGCYPFVDAGERSVEVSESEYLEENVDIFVSHICDGGRMTEFREYREDWSLPDQVYFLYDDCVNQLSPNTITGIENFASIFHNYTIDEKRFVEYI